MNTLTNSQRKFQFAGWLVGALMFLVPVPARSRGQEQPPPPPPPTAATAEQQPVVVIKKESKLVLVDSVVTDKKGNYIRDLTQNNFKVFEDNKEQAVSTFSTGADAATQANGQRRYLILFFDNSTPDAPVSVASTGLPSLGSSLGNAAADFGARSMLLAVRSLAKNLRSIPGRKMVVLFSGGFPLTQENQSELTATIDACNKSNVAVYALDARGLTAPVPGGSARRNVPAGKTHVVSNRPSNRGASARPRILLAAFPASAMPDPQRPGGGGGQGGGTGGGGGGRGGGTGGGGTGGGG